MNLYTWNDKTDLKLADLYELCEQDISKSALSNRINDAISRGVSFETAVYNAMTRKSSKLGKKRGPGKKFTNPVIKKPLQPLFWSATSASKNRILG